MQPRERKAKAPPRLAGKVAIVTSAGSGIGAAILQRFLEDRACIPPGGEPSKRGYETLSRTLPANPRAARPQEIAAVAAFLASDDASFANGATLVADGGWPAS